MAELRALDELLAEVARQGRVLTDFLSSNSYYQPTFSGSGFKDYPELPDDVDDARRRLQEASKAVHDLAAGPKLFLKHHTPSYNDIAAMKYICHSKVPEAIPLVGSAPYEQVAGACNVDESQLRCMLRLAMTNNVFHETSSDEVGHTAYSSVLVTDRAMRAVVEYQCFEAFPASAKLVEACEKWPDAQQANHSAWSLANQSDLSYFEQLSEPGNEGRAKRFADYMSARLSAPEGSTRFTLSAYDWKSIEGTIVDIGGNVGQAAIALARAFPDMPQIIVQDLPAIIDHAQMFMPTKLDGRIRFQAHDLSTSQPEEVMQAQLLLLRFVLHNYADKSAAQILRNIVPALEKGATLLIFDIIAPDVGQVSALTERAIRTRHIEAMTMFNGKERNMDEWRGLLQMVDKSLVIKDVKLQEGSGLGCFEVAYGR